jgi:hypothetical protein
LLRLLQYLRYLPRFILREFKRVTEISYLGYAYGTMAALRRMKPRDQGTIVHGQYAAVLLGPGPSDVPSSGQSTRRGGGSP